MRALALVLPLLLTLLVCVLTYLAVVAVARRRGARRSRAARWQTRNYTRDGKMIVAVTLIDPDGRALDEHVVDRIPEADPDWTGRLLLAREIAEERAVHLNIGGTALPPG